MKKLGECLIQAGLITHDDLQAALAEQRRTGDRIGAIFIRLNLATEKQVTKALAHQAGLAYVSLTDDPPERAAIVLVPKDVALARICVAVKLDRNLLTVATADPLSTSLAHDLERLSGHAIRRVVATTSDILESIASGYPIEAVTTAGRVEPVAPLPAAISDETVDTDGSHQSAVDDLLSLIVHRAIASGATDLHIDPRESGAVVRHRIDGVLTEPLDLPEWARDAIVARIKARAGLEVAEVHRPQSGRVRLTASEGREVEFRAFTLPTVFGEKVVLRAVRVRRPPLPLEELGLTAGAMETVRDFIRQSHGMVLVVGPSVSGKTTTLVSALSTIVSDAMNIVTIEPVVEYEIPGVNQTELIDTLPAASALDAVLQQDADVLLIGDLRDRDITRMAFRSAQKRQLVLAAFHADSAAAAVSQLATLSIDPSTVSSTLVGVIAQRLVRRLCVTCRRQYTPDAATLRDLSIPETSAAEMAFYHAVGCDECHHTGFRGRIALYEVMRVTEDIRRLIAQNAGADLIREAALAGGMVPLADDGLGKVKAGVTTADELLRVLTEVRHVRLTCPECGGDVAAEFNVCPHCAHRLSGGCHKCGRTLQSEWQYCPYCAATAHKKKKKSKDHKTLDLPGSNVAEFKNQSR